MSHSDEIRATMARDARIYLNILSGLTALASLVMLYDVTVRPPIFFTGMLYGMLITNWQYLRFDLWGGDK